MAGTLLGILYVGMLSSYFFLLRDLPRKVGRPEGDGGWFLLSVFIITWVCDTGAFAVGVLWGKHRLLPRVSPKKSVEGALGGLIWALLAAWLLGSVLLKGLLPLRHFLSIAIVVSVAGPLGDLAESLMKRDAGVKDTSRLLPGHGGVLDRFDSLLFIVPAVYWYIKYVVF
jgi:phosphatidate cytidylyltransferase